MWKTIFIVILALIPVCFAHGQIPTAERIALTTLYDETNGPGWGALIKNSWRLDDDSDFKPPGTECEWLGVTCVLDSNVQRIDLNFVGLTGQIPDDLEDLTFLEVLNLPNNSLNGPIPKELGKLSNLKSLVLTFNQLTGGIPLEFGALVSLETLALNHNKLSDPIPLLLANAGNLPNLKILNLYNNQLGGMIPENFKNLTSLTHLVLKRNYLSGFIPADIGDLTDLQTLQLDSNRLTGPIPVSLGLLANLTWLELQSNRLSGPIPASLSGLTSLGSNSLDLRWNALYPDVSSPTGFLNSKQIGGDWQSTQTIAPENVDVDRVGDHTVWLTWDTVSYQSNRGGYSVCSAPTSSGAWTCDGWTEEKTDTTYPVTGLDPATTYDLAVVTYTDPHTSNQNVVNSDFSVQVMATTATVGCAQPEIEIMWGNPITLVVTESYGSYLWITGETTPTIDIDPLYDQWYWVTVTSDGPCEETALTWVDPTTVFANGFESGDSTRWSKTVP